MERCHNNPRPVLILEGEGDRDAVPILLRRISLEKWSTYLDVKPSPIIKQSIPTLKRPGGLEKFLSYAAERDCDSVLVVLDSDDECPMEIAKDFTARAQNLHCIKRIGVSFFVREFESLFLSCLDVIAQRYPDYGWNLSGWTLEQNHEQVRGAKELITNYMKKGKAYKETRDQAKFVSCVNFDRLRENNRSFVHFESLVEWLLFATKDAPRVFPE